jgi:glycosyltransferase involved in cell wall biosynthesis
MKILYLIHEFYPAHHGGSEKFILQLAQRVQAAGHEVKIITYDKQNHQPQPTLSPLTRWQQRLKRLVVAATRRTGLRVLRPKLEPIQYYEEVYDGVPVFGFRAAQLDQARFHLADPNLTAFAEAVLQREAPDLIHAGYLLRNGEFIYAAQRLGIPYLITLTSFWLICPKHILINEKGQLCAGPRDGAECLSACPTSARGGIATRYADMQRIFDHADAVIAPSHYLAQIFQRELSHLSLTYIPYGMDCQRLPVNHRVYATDQPLVFFFGGRLVPEKGIDLLLTAFQRLVSPHIRLQLYGDGRLRERVQQAVRADPRITYGGVYTHEEVGDLLKQADVVLIPSLWPENLPLIMQEAQAAGVPTLVADVGGMTECVADGVNGFTFRVGDVADLQQKMQMIIDQPEILNGIKENIRNPKPGQYRVTSLEEEATLYLEQYERILTRSQQVVG